MRMNNNKRNNKNIIKVKHRLYYSLRWNCFLFRCVVVFVYVRCYHVFFLLFCKYWYRNRHTSTDSWEGLSAAAASMADMFYTHSMEFFFLILLPLSFSLCVLLSMFWFAYFSSVSFDFVCVKKTGFHGICLNFFFFFIWEPKQVVSVCVFFTFGRWLVSNSLLCVLSTWIHALIHGHVKRTLPEHNQRSQNEQYNTTVIMEIMEKKKRRIE